MTSEARIYLLLRNATPSDRQKIQRALEAHDPAVAYRHLTQFPERHWTLGDASRMLREWRAKTENALAWYQYYSEANKEAQE